MKIFDEDRILGVLYVRSWKKHQLITEILIRAFHSTLHHRAAWALRIEGAVLGCKVQAQEPSCSMNSR